MAHQPATPSATSPAHTPGPWRTDSIGHDRVWILDSNSNYLAEIVAKDECGFAVPTDQQHANARLIAAAPELLEACHALFTALTEYIGETPDEELSEREQYALTLYDAATARAAGAA